VKIDLHLHSCYSGDGIHNIGFLTQLFSAGDIVALTDHETIAGWDEFKVECEKRGLKPIFGIEWFADDCHILSYFPNPNVSEEFKEFIAERRKKERIAMKFVSDLYYKEHDSFPEYENLLKMKTHPENILGMIILGCKVKRIKGIEFKDAIDEIRKRKHTSLECPEIFNSDVIINNMSNWGAVNVLAHPFNRKACDDNAVKLFHKLVIRYKNAGLNGIELHPNDDEINKKIKSICNRLGLIWTIGSDYHCYKRGIYPCNLDDNNEEILKGLRKLNLV
jgi:predicted metal-dependent phosphoesterase TrpH